MSEGSRYGWIENHLDGASVDRAAKAAAIDQTDAVAIGRSTSRAVRYVRAREHSHGSRLGGPSAVPASSGLLRSRSISEPSAPALDPLGPLGPPRGFSHRIPIFPDPPQVSDGLADLLGLERQPRPSPPARPLRPISESRNPAVDPVAEIDQVEGPTDARAVRREENLDGAQPDGGAVVVDPETGDERTVDRVSVERLNALADRHRALFALQREFLDAFDRVESGAARQEEAARDLLNRIDALLPSDTERGAPAPGNLRLRQTLQRLATDIFDAGDRADAEAIFFDTFVASPEAQEAAELIFGLVPGLGEALSARDAYEGFLAALAAAEDSRARDALSSAAAAGVSALGAIPVLGKPIQLTRGGVKASVAVSQVVTGGTGRAARQVSEQATKRNPNRSMASRPDTTIGELDKRVEEIAKQRGYKITRRDTATNANKEFPSEYDPLPYKLGSKTTTVRLTRRSVDEFVRVHGKKNQARGWIMRKEDIFDPRGRRLSPEELFQKFSLPAVPTEVSKVELPAGTLMRIGSTNRSERCSEWECRAI